jgi:hypothetical protein
MLRIFSAAALCVALLSPAYAQATSVEAVQVDETTARLDLVPQYQCKMRERGRSGWGAWPATWSACPSGLEFSGLTTGNQYRFRVRMVGVTSNLLELAGDPPPPPLPVTGYPNPGNTGVPAGWVPVDTRGSMTVSQSGSVIQDIRINGSLTINANDVTVRRVEVLGGGITTRNGTMLDQVSVISPGRTTEAVGPGGYTALRVKIHGSEGFRVGGKSSGYGPVHIENSFALIEAPATCGDWHGDGVQGYDGPALTVRGLTIDFRERSGCGGTAPFFYPHSQGNTSADVERLLVMGGGAPLRLGMPGRVVGSAIVNNSWGYFPKDVKCSVITDWDVKIVEIGDDYQVTSVIRNEPCNTETGG